MQPSDAGTASLGDAGAKAVPDARAVAVQDAAEVAAPPSGEADAAKPVSEPATDSGRCTDTDMDGVCDDVDNCPDAANRGQQDTDGDGVGDACQPKVQANCGTPDPLSSTVGDGTVSQVRINNVAGSVAQVTAGATVDLLVTVTFSSCGGVYAMQSLYIGLDAASASCKPASCSDQVSLNIPLPFTMTAPSEPGLHYVLAGLTTSFCGAPAGNNSPVKTPIAALCVSPP